MNQKLLIQSMRVFCYIGYWVFLVAAFYEVTMPDIEVALTYALIAMALAKGTEIEVKAE